MLYFEFNKTVNQLNFMYYFKMQLFEQFYTTKKINVRFVTIIKEIKHHNNKNHNCECMASSVQDKLEFQI